MISPLGYDEPELGLRGKDHFKKERCQQKNGE